MDTVYLPPPGNEVVAHVIAEHDQVPVGIIDGSVQYAHAVHDTLHVLEREAGHEHSGTLTE